MKVLLFSGAGTSMELGVPGMIGMGEEFLDLHTYVNGLLSMGTLKKVKYKPFHKVVLGRPALGTYGIQHPYGDDIVTVAKVVCCS